MPIELTDLTPLLQVFDMPASLRFYRDLLGFEVVEASSPDDQADWVWLRLGGADLMLNTAYERHERPPASPEGRREAHADVGLYFGCPDADATYAALRRAGLQAEPPAIRPYGMKQLSVLDPDGYHLCFQWPARAEA